MAQTRLMNILLVGSGGREHALAWKIAQSDITGRLVCAPGNPGIAKVAELRPIAASDVAGLVALAREIPADLVVIGPETAIEAGLADRLAAEGIPCFGPSGRRRTPGILKGLRQELRRAARFAKRAVRRV